MTMRSAKDLVAEANREVETLSAEEALAEEALAHACLSGLVDGFADLRLRLPIGR